MKLISFPHYTCGGLLCDILNDTWSPVDVHGGIVSIQHNRGKIGDAAGIYDDFDEDALFESLVDVDPTSWTGTHCWLGNLQRPRNMQVINVTTVTYRSRLYRWTRAWHHLYAKSLPWQGLYGIDAIDKHRETAKNYISSFQPVHQSNFVNIEFSDIVECKPSFLKLVGSNVDRHMDRWREVNDFLFRDSVWTSDPAQRFHEAEYEISLGQPYVYQ